jgi:hypothetical protein
MAYYGIALHTPEFGSSVYMVFFFGALSELPMTIISKLISHKFSVADRIRDPVPFLPLDAGSGMGKKSGSGSGTN